MMRDEPYWTWRTIGAGRCDDSLEDLSRPARRGPGGEKSWGGGRSCSLQPEDPYDERRRSSGGVEGGMRRLIRPHS